MNAGFTDNPAEITWLEATCVINGKLWIQGHGKLPCRVLVIGEHPGKDEVKNRDLSRGKYANLLFEALDNAKIPREDVYCTHAVKYDPRKTVNVSDVTACSGIMAEEIKRAQASLIIPMGNNALKAVMGKAYKLSDCRATQLKHEETGADVFPVYSPWYILKKPEAKTQWLSEIRMAKRILAGLPLTDPPPDVTTIRSVEEMQLFHDFLSATYEKFDIVLDCEWEGENHMMPGAYIRTIQLGYDDGKCATIELYDETKACCLTRMGPTGRMDHTLLSDEEKLEIRKGVMGLVGEILTSKQTYITGHNVRADGHWLLAEGIDIRPVTVYDTMIAEHTGDSRGPFGLDELTLKYTDLGRYDDALVKWKMEHPKDCERGYGAVPDAIILPYGGCDVEGPRQIRKIQLPKLAPFMEPRGKYPSLFDIDMFCANALYEPEIEGLRVDIDRFRQLRTMYTNTLGDLEGAILTRSRELGVDAFNPRSTAQVRDLLFNRLGLTPVKTTKAHGGKPWEWVIDQDDDTQEMIAAATDKDSLAILSDQPGADVIVQLLRDFRKVAYVVSSWMVDDENAARFSVSDRGGGILAKLWPDGKLHARFSQLKETARLGSAKPNVQFWAL